MAVVQCDFISESGQGWARVPLFSKPCCEETLGLVRLMCSHDQVELCILKPVSCRRDMLMFCLLYTSDAADDPRVV